MENGRDASRSKQETLEILKTGGCPFVGEPCPDELTVLSSDIDHICQKCVEWHFMEGSL